MSGAGFGPQGGEGIVTAKVSDVSNADRIADQEARFKAALEMVDLNPNAPSWQEHGMKLATQSAAILAELRHQSGDRIVLNGADITGLGVASGFNGNGNNATLAEPDVLREAAQAIIERMFSTYKARNGRDVGVQGDDGEKVWLVHSDEIVALESALAATEPTKEVM